MLLAHCPICDVLVYFMLLYSSTGSLLCNPCPPGSFNNNTGADSCTSCSPGVFIWFETPIWGLVSDRIALIYFQTNNTTVTKWPHILKWIKTIDFLFVCCLQVSFLHIRVPLPAHHVHQELSASRFHWNSHGFLLVCVFCCCCVGGGSQHGPLVNTLFQHHMLSSHVCVCQHSCSHTRKSQLHSPWLDLLTQGIRI